MDFWNDDRFRSWLKQQAQMQTYLRQFNNLPKHRKPPVLDSATLQSLTVAQNTLRNVSLPPPLASSLLGTYAQLAGRDINLLKQIRSMNVSWLQQIQPVVPFDQLQILRDQVAVFDRMAWKMTTLGQITISLPDALLTTWKSISTVLQHLNLYHQSILSRYTVEAVRDHVTLVEASLIPPTLTTAAFVDVTYDLVEDHLTRKNEVHERSSRFQTSSFEEGCN